MASGGNRITFVVRVWPQIGMFQWMVLNPQVHEQQIGFGKRKRHTRGEGGSGGSWEEVKELI